MEISSGKVLAVWPAVLVGLLLFASCDRPADSPSGDEVEPGEATAPATEIAPVGPAEATPDLVDGIDEYVETTGHAAAPAFRHVAIDLNDDDRHDSIVLLQGPEWCGADGCTMLVFRGDDEGALLMSTTTAASEPVRVSSGRTAGWNDLIVRSTGSGDVVLRFDGDGYPADPSLQPRATPEQVRAAQTLPLNPTGYQTPP